MQKLASKTLKNEQWAMKSSALRTFLRPLPLKRSLATYKEILKTHFEIATDAERLIYLSDGSLHIPESRLQISLSHKNDLLFYSLYDSQVFASVGCDLEALSESERDWRVYYGRFFTHQDFINIQRYAQIKKCPLAQAHLVFFSAKEAVLKLKQLTVDPLAFSVHVEAMTPDSLQAHFSEVSSISNSGITVLQEEEQSMIKSVALLSRLHA